MVSGLTIYLTDIKSHHYVLKAPPGSIFEPAILATFGKTCGKTRTILVRTFLAVSVFLFFGKIEIGENTDKKIGKVRTRLRKSTDPKMKTRTKN